MSDKAMGTCPFCLDDMVPNVIEENYVRRDKCECSSCGKIIYVCRNIGCHDYAKGGDFYDDELCTSCTKALAGGVVGVASTFLAAALKK